MIQHPFVEFLTERNLIPLEIARKLVDTKSFIREPIGMIAVGHGLLRPSEIDTILDHQRDHKDQRFGEIAVELGCLTPNQVETLVKIQELRTSAGIAESLALGGVLSTDDTAHYLGAFLARDHEIATMLSEG